MATYEFLCKKCNIHWEKQMSMNEGHIDICPKCKKKVSSIVTGGSGFVFKGPGFPSNDFKKAKEATQYEKELDAILPGKKEAEAIKKTKKYKKLVEGK